MFCFIDHLLIFLTSEEASMQAVQPANLQKPYPPQNMMFSEAVEYYFNI
jgi:hypothetical protein